MRTVYDVTTWSVPGSDVTAESDIGLVINAIIADIKQQQDDPGNRPGAVIYIPPGTYRLGTQVVIDVSYLQIKGSGHGFFSNSIRDFADTGGWYERTAGGSRIAVDLRRAPAILVRRAAAPRLNSIELTGFCLDGVAFDGSATSYRNGKTGIDIQSDNDSVVLAGLGMVYLERGLRVRGADALAIRDNFIAECGSCIELVGAGMASSVLNYHLGAGPAGYSVFAENHFGLLVSGNNIFPRGRSMVHLRACTDSSITGNRLHGFHPGMIELEGGCADLLIQGNHLRREPETFDPFKGVTTGRDDLFGLIHLVGSGHLVTGNLLTHRVPAAQITPPGAAPTGVLVASGTGMTLMGTVLRSTAPARSVVIDARARDTTVVDCGRVADIVDHATTSRIRPLP